MFILTPIFDINNTSKANKNLANQCLSFTHKGLTFCILFNAMLLHCVYRPRFTRLYYLSDIIATKQLSNTVFPWVKKRMRAARKRDSCSPASSHFRCGAEKN